MSRFPTMMESIDEIAEVIYMADPIIQSCSGGNKIVPWAEVSGTDKSRTEQRARAVYWWLHSPAKDRT